MVYRVSGSIWGSGDSKIDKEQYLGKTGTTSDGWLFHVCCCPRCTATLGSPTFLRRVDSERW
jgi:hypothetical protein